MTDWSSYYKREESKGSSKKAVGNLRCVITEAGTQTSKAGKDMIVVSVKPSGSDFSVKNYMVKNEYFNRNMTSFFDAFPEIEEGDFDFLKWIGAEGAAHFVLDDNGYTKVKYFISADRAENLPPFMGDKPEKLEVTSLDKDFSDVNEDDLPF